MPAVLLLLVAAVAAAGEHPGRGVFYAAGCRACHRVGDSGGDAGPDLTLVGLRRSRAWLEVWLTKPSAWKADTRMPDQRLAPGDRAAVADYLASLKGQDFAPAPWRRPGLEPGLVGRTIYAKAGCAACHGAAGEGGHPNNNVPGGRIPSLAALASTYTLDELKARVRRGSKPDREDPKGPEPLVAMPAWGGVLSEQEIAAVSAHVLGLASARTEDW